MIERLDPELADDRGRPKVQGLVLAPTRELATLGQGASRAQYRSFNRP